MADSVRPREALITGLGLGGFIDGIVLHQILQWHHMLSDTGDHPTTTVAGLEANTLADGLVEGVVDHQLLGIHHVRDDLGAPLGWDVGFLAFGALLAVGGLALARSAAPPRAS